MNSKIEIKADKEIKIELVSFIINHIAYFVVFSILIFLFPMFLSGTIIINTYNGMQSDNTQFIIILIIALFLTSSFSLFTLKKKHLFKVTINHEEISITTKTITGVIFTEIIPQEKLKFLLLKHGRSNIRLDFIKGFDCIGRIDINNEY